MRHLEILAICLLAIALHGKAWAQIYETKDAEGNTEFTDSPPSENAKQVDLQQTNIADAPGPDSPDEPRLDPTNANQPAPAQAPVDENNVVIERDGYDGGVYEDGAYVDGADERALRREDAVRRADPDAPHEVGDSEMDMPHEVGDTAAQERREVGDSEAQMPREVGDMPVHAGEEHRR